MQLGQKPHITDILSLKTNTLTIRRLKLCHTFNVIDPLSHTS